MAHVLLGNLLYEPRPPAAVRGASHAPAVEGKPLFSDLVASAPRPRRQRFGVGVSLAAHAALAGLLVLVPILWPIPLPEQGDRYIRALLYDPPPPPPRPLPKGSALLPQSRPPRPVTPAPSPQATALAAPVEPQWMTEKLKPEAGAPESEQWGSATGTDAGVPEGMEGGIEGGEVGGLPGGVLGGFIGGTGDIPVVVHDYDQPPRVIRQPRPLYPQDAFVKKIEGVVVLEILIDTGGRVVRARVVHSVPLLDAAALEAVRQWLFTPAIKRGRPVATVAEAPITFRIY